MKMKRNNELKEKFLNYGLSIFSDIDVLETLLGLRLDENRHRRNAKKMLTKYKSLSETINAAFHYPESIPCISEDYLFGLRLPHEMANRYLSDKLRQKPIINSSESLISYLNHSMRGLEVEHFKVIYLNGRNMFMADEYISKGTITTAAIYPREIMKSALKHNAAALIFAHNHPSGNSNPSQDDLTITKRLCEAAKLLEIQVHDHIIITDNEYYSFADKGLI